jgi:D-aminoacyl-tRNA deacylase
LRAVVQRVSEARVIVAGGGVGAIGPGLLVLLGVARGDSKVEAERLAEKIAQLRIFENEAGKLDRSVVDAGGQALVVSQFTLIADTRKGNRPSFSDAAPAEEARNWYDVFCHTLSRYGVPVSRGVFGARMAIELTADGPVTIVIE